MHLAGEEYTAKFRVDISDLKKGIQDASREMQMANAQFRATAAGMDDWAHSADGLEAKLKQLQSNLQSQNAILSNYREQLKKQEEGYAENGRRADELRAKLQQLADEGVSKSDAKYKEYANALKSVAQEQANNGKACDDLRLKILNQEAAVGKTESAIRKYETAQKSLEASSKSLSNTVEQQRQRLDQLKKAYVDVISSEGKNSASAKALASEIRTLAADLNKNETYLKKNTDEANKLDGSFQKTSASTSAFASKLGGVLKSAAIGAAAALAAVGAAVVKIGTEAIKSYADYEQLVGGVETLFGAGGKSLAEYAEMQGKAITEVNQDYIKLKKAENIVFKNASEAYEAAGISANEYMQTVTSFSASLIQSLGGDTEQAAKIANRAIIDMSDNSNKIGTDLSTIQNAYQSFARGQFQLLDNLRIGYSGTKSEMERLIADAAKLTDIQERLGVTVTEGNLDFSNIINAISVIQEKMGIAGTTAEEAATTIQGSLKMLKSAWKNVLTGIADDSQNFDKLIANLQKSLMTFLSNLIPRIKASLKGISNLVKGFADELLPPLLEMIPELARDLLPTIQSVFRTLLSAFVEMSPELVTLMFELINDAAMAIIDALPQIVEAGMQIAAQLAIGIAENAQTLINASLDCFFKILDTLLAEENLNTLIDAGIQMTLALVNGLLQATPQIIEKTPEIIMALVEALISNAPALQQAGIDLMVAFIEGVASSNEAMQEVMLRLIHAAIQTFNSTDWASLGKNLVDGIVSGVNQWAHKLWESVKSLAAGAVSFVKSALSINSPSKVFANEVGKYIPLGIAAGIEKAIPQLNREMQKMMDTVKKPAIQFNAANAVKAGKGWAGSFAANVAAQNPNSIVNGNTITNEGARTNNFTQIINAPKAPSRIELYRQTRNLLQFAGQAGAV